MSSKTLSKSEIKRLNEETQQLYGISLFNKKDFLQLIEMPIKYISLNKEPILFYHEQKIIPFLKTIIKNPFLKKITVDMGSIKFICNGADIMRPGIVEIQDNIKEKEIIMIIDEKNQKPIVIGETLFSGEEIKQKTEGKVIKNLHYVSDDKWSLS